MVAHNCFLTKTSTLFLIRFFQSNFYFYTEIKIFLRWNRLSEYDMTARTFLEQKWKLDLSHEVTPFVLSRYLFGFERRFKWKFQLKSGFNSLSLKKLSLIFRLVRYYGFYSGLKVTNVYVHHLLQDSWTKIFL